MKCAVKLAWKRFLSLKNPPISKEIYCLKPLFSYNRYMKNFLALLLFLCSLQLFSQETFDVYDGKVIRKISVIFDTKSQAPDETRSIQDRLRTKSGDVFSSSTFDEDLKTLAKNNRSVIPQVKIEDNQLEITIYVYPKTVLS
ncbi:MAG: hypothetical protein EB053_03735, partial [Chlamydiae bacterium]|nr:hypothetical protein [Chlamydiota bacterium]